MLKGIYMSKETKINQDSKKVFVDCILSIKEINQIYASELSTEDPTDESKGKEVIEEHKIENSK